MEHRSAATDGCCCNNEDKALGRVQKAWSDSLELDRGSGCGDLILDEIRLESTHFQYLMHHQAARHEQRPLLETISLVDSCLADEAAAQAFLDFMIQLGAPFYKLYVETNPYFENNEGQQATSSSYQGWAYLLRRLSSVPTLTHLCLFGLDLRGLALPLTTTTTTTRKGFLQELELSYCKVNEQVMRTLFATTNHHYYDDPKQQPPPPGLRKLVMKMCDLQDVEFQVLAQALITTSSRSLQVLDMSCIGTLTSSTQLTNLAILLRHCQNLEELHMRHCVDLFREDDDNNNNNSGFADFSHALATAPQLRRLDLESCGIVDRQAVVLFQALQETALLQVLDLSGNPITALSFAGLVQLLDASDSSLETLSVNSCPNLFRGGLLANAKKQYQEWATVLGRNTRLKTLDLYNCGMSSAALTRPLFQALEHNTTLRKLNIVQDGVQLGRSSGLAHSLPHLRALETLCVHDWNVTELWPALQRNTSLTQVLFMVPPPPPPSSSSSSSPESDDTETTHIMENLYLLWSRNHILKARLPPVIRKVRQGQVTPTMWPYCLLQLRPDQDATGAFELVKETQNDLFAWHQQQQRQQQRDEQQ